jgi:hypothetical protein
MIGCAESDRVDNRNFAIDTYNPTPNEIQLAEQRLETSKVFPSEVQLLWPKLINSETTASFFSQKRGGFSNLQLRCILIYDTRNGHFVSDRGFISVDKPPLGSIARFDDYIARYIGFGNWG